MPLSPLGEDGHPIGKIEDAFGMEVLEMGWCRLRVFQLVGSVVYPRTYVMWDSGPIDGVG